VPAGDERQRTVTLDALAEIRDRVLAGAEPLEGAALLDVGTGDGLIGVVRFAEAAGFERIHLECHIDIEPGSLTRTISIGALLGSSPNPLAPTVGETIVEALAPEDRERFIGHLAQAVERGDGIRRSAVAYLTATKPV
jgi:hypothetical protein